MSLTFDDFEELLRIASYTTTLAEDPHLVVAHARILEEWATGPLRLESGVDPEEVEQDTQRRMSALRQVDRNLSRAGKPLMDKPEELCRMAAIFYAFLGGDVALELTGRVHD